MQIICENARTRIFGIIKGLHEGEVPYKFIVFFYNGHHEWHFDPKKPTITDAHGHINNIINVVDSFPTTPTPSPSPSPFSRSPFPAPSLVDHIRSVTPNLTLNRYLSPYINHNDSTYSHLISRRPQTPNSKEHHEENGISSNHNEFVHRHQPSPSVSRVDETLLVPTHNNPSFVHQRQPSPSSPHVIDHNKSVHIEHSKTSQSRQSITLELPSLHLHPNESTLVHHPQPSSLHNVDSNGKFPHFQKVPHETKESKDLNASSIPTLVIITPKDPQQQEKSTQSS